ncbi:hypothetical protein [Aquirufa aurantiipilula]|uniref:hypothetical protein n=1 Tax=Aquirufa aurantiipilula TaxID=2696561 RepID=UPI0030B74168|nr:hypothetical protein [Aquirufa aurantiipilula]
MNDNLSEQQILNLIAKSANEFGVNGKDLNKLIDCLGQKLKNNYPNFPNGIKKSQLKELQELSKLSTIQCIKSGSLNLTLKWTPFLEEILYDKFYGLEELKSFGSEKRKMFTECVIAGIKNQNPNGFNLKNGSANRNPAGSPVLKCKYLLLD